MKYGSGRDPYVDENGILINKLGAKTEEDLDFAENLFSLRKLTLLHQNSLAGHFDLAHLRAIHRYLFEDIYTWAGELRTISISKGNTMFALPLRIAPEANKLFEKLKAENYLRGLTKTELAKGLAFYLGEINMLHPFREGNGRTQRAFITLLAQHLGYTLHFRDITPEQMIEASIQVNLCRYDLFEQLILERLKKQ